jgi:hypothetical protein
VRAQFNHMKRALRQHDGVQHHVKTQMWLLSWEFKRSDSEVMRHALVTFGE